MLTRLRFVFVSLSRARAHSQMGKNADGVAQPRRAAEQRLGTLCHPQARTTHYALQVRLDVIRSVRVHFVLLSQLTTNHALDDEACVRSMKDRLTPRSCCVCLICKHTHTHTHAHLYCRQSCTRMCFASSFMLSQEDAELPAESAEPNAHRCGHQGVNLWVSMFSHA